MDTASRAIERYKLIEDSYRDAKKCETCGRLIKGSKSAMKSHMEIHAGTSRSYRAVALQASREKAMAEFHDPNDLYLVRQMHKSYPTAVRHRGGFFTRGPLAEAAWFVNKAMYRGMPRYFSQDGRIKPRYDWIVKKPVNPSSPDARHHTTTNQEVETQTQVNEKDERMLLRDAAWEQALIKVEGEEEGSVRAP
ncbi:Fc.00g014720.m01.CDS01 [Cosmosporella sp. VM-42]